MMKRLIRNILVVLCMSLLSTVTSAFAADERTHTSERLENVASVVVNTSGISLRVNTEKIERFHIFSITGQLVKAVDVEPGITLNVELPRGCYIIKCSYWSKKVLVK